MISEHTGWTLKEYQTEITNLLAQLFGFQIPVEAEWRSEFGQGIYSPRIDIAVGPFATAHGERYTEKYDLLLKEKADYINRIVEYHLTNTDEKGISGDVIKRLTEINRNARCFMAIEIERSGSRKHLMGDAINAAALGRIGIAIGWTPTMFRAFLNVKRYFAYLKQVEKSTFLLDNLLILKPEQFIDTVRGFV